MRISHENISSYSGPLSICNAAGGLDIHITDSSFSYNGSMNISNSSIRFNQSCLKGNVYTDFTNDTIVSINSTFKVVHPFLGKKYYFVTSLYQNGQPISSSSTSPYTYSGSTLPVMPVSTVQACFNYTMNSASSQIFINFSMGSNFNFSKTILLNNTGGLFYSNFSLPVPWYDKNLTKGEKIPVQYTLNLQAGITIWRSKFNFLTNSSLNVSGLGHNFIILHHCKMLAINSTFTGNSGQWDFHGFINSSRMGIWIDNGSRLTFLNTGIHGNLTSSIGNCSPILAVGNSMLAIWKAPIVESYANNYSHQDANINFTGIGGNYSSTRRMAKDCMGNFTKGNFNSGRILLVFENETSTVSFGIFKYRLYGRNRYISSPITDFYLESFPVENITLLNASSLHMKTFVKGNGGILTVYMKIESSGGNSTDIRAEYSIKYHGTTYTGNINTGILFNGEVDNYTKNISRFPDMNPSSLSINSTITYNNTYFVQSVRINNEISLEPYYFTYRVMEIGIPQGEVWSVNFSGTTYSSSGNCVEINSTQSYACVLPFPTGYFRPEVNRVKELPGNSTFYFSPIVGNFTVVCNSSLKYNLSIENISVYDREGNYTIMIPYGNYTLFISSGNINRKIQIWVNSPDRVVYAGIYPIQDTNSSLAQSILGTFIFISAILCVCRKLFISFCPKCMAVKRPFGIRVHHCPSGMKCQERTIL